MAVNNGSLYQTQNYSWKKVRRRLKKQSQIKLKKDHEASNRLTELCLVGDTESKFISADFLFYFSVDEKEKTKFLCNFRVMFFRICFTLSFFKVLHRLSLTKNCKTYLFEQCHLNSLPICIYVVLFTAAHPKPVYNSHWMYALLPYGGSITTIFRKSLRVSSFLLHRF